VPEYPINTVLKIFRGILGTFWRLENLNKWGA